MMDTCVTPCEFSCRCDFLISMSEVNGNRNLCLHARRKATAPSRIQHWILYNVWVIMQTLVTKSFSVSCMRYFIQMFLVDIVTSCNNVTRDARRLFLGPSEEGRHCHLVCTSCGTCSMGCTVCCWSTTCMLSRPTVSFHTWHDLMRVTISFVSQWTTSTLNYIILHRHQKEAIHTSCTREIQQPVHQCTFPLMNPVISDLWSCTSMWIIIISLHKHSETYIKVTVN